jgi:hypothetical protein
MLAIVVPHFFETANQITGSPHSHWAKAPNGTHHLWHIKADRSGEVSQGLSDSAAHRS